MDQVLYSDNTKHILTYIFNDTYYFAGGGTSGLHTSEVLEAGPVLYAFLSAGLGWFLAWMLYAMQKPWMHSLSIYRLSTAFCFPRGAFLFKTLIMGKARHLYFATEGFHNNYPYHEGTKTPALQVPGTGSDGPK